MRALVVEDEPSLLQMLAQTLREQGYTVEGQGTTFTVQLPRLTPPQSASTREAT